MKFNLKDCFICDYCRNICKSSCNDIKEKILDIKILTKEVMSYLKINYFGRYDSTKVLQFIKEI